MINLYWRLVLVLILLLGGMALFSTSLAAGIADFKGYILLAVEENGEAYYYYPDDGKRYYLGRPNDAFDVMRRLGLGATHEYIHSHEIFPKDVLGKILLDVESNGEAYYIYPKDKKKYYLGRPADAFGVMRDLGLGATTANISLVQLGGFGPITTEIKPGWELFEDIELGIGYQQPMNANCWQNGAGPGGNDTNALVCDGFFFQYEPLVFNYHTLSLKEIADAYYEINLNDDNPNVPIDRILTEVEETSINGYPAFQFDIGWGMSYLSYDDPTKDRGGGILDEVSKLIFTEYGGTQIMVIAPLNNSNVDEVLNTFIFLEDEVL